ncbi:atlastin-1-like isoform X2 [Amblyomma americanum]
MNRVCRRAMWPLKKGGRPVQILRAMTDGSWELDAEALQKILLDDRVKDKPVAVVSVAGVYRKGKSFLLGFFLRYMQSQCKEQWLGSKDETLEGFSWRGGCERDTTGILLWDEVFLVTTSEGKEVAVLLMDTQGTFDCESTTKQSAIVFALSTLISSVQVYNISGNITESDLQQLQFFAEYGRLAQKDGNEKPFQKLMFLVRDWYYTSDADHGAEGGRKIIEKRLQVSESQPEELQQLRRHLKSCFSDIDCFLMPHPGPKVAESNDFDGRVSDIDEKFVINLEKFVPLVLAGDTLQEKVINGQKVSCQGLASYIESYMKAFAGNELPEPISVLQATAEANNLAAVAAGEEFYLKEMEEVVKLGLSADKLKEEHRKLHNKAVELFHTFPKMGGDMMADKYVDKLAKKIELLYTAFKARNRTKAKRFFEVIRVELYLLAADIRLVMRLLAYGALRCTPNILRYQALRRMYYRNMIRNHRHSDHMLLPWTSDDNINSSDGTMVQATEVPEDSHLFNTGRTESDTGPQSAELVTGASASICTPTLRAYQDTEDDREDEAPHDLHNRSMSSAALLPAVLIGLVPALYFSPVGFSMDGLCSLIMFCITLTASSLVVLFVSSCVRCRGDINVLGALVADLFREHLGGARRSSQSVRSSQPHDALKYVVYLWVSKHKKRKALPNNISPRNRRAAGSILYTCARARYVIVFA